MKLTKQQFWNSRHEICSQPGSTRAQTRKGVFRQLVDNARRKSGAQIGQSYNDFAIRKLLKSHLPVRRDWSVIEIGCAPGMNCMSLHRDFGYKPYGVEYSHAGVVLTQETFHKHGFDTANVIDADFFDPEFHNRFRESFEVVFSAGFVEHFDPPEEVLHLHINLLKPGGYWVCIIPNLRGLFYPFLWLCARDVLKAHNCKLMRKDEFRSTFELFGLDVKFCGYVGGFQFYGSSLKHEHNLRGFAARGLDRVQYFLDHCLFLFDKGTFPESRWSASLVFVGRRTS